MRIGQIRGTAGTIRWGYFAAATLGPWTVTHEAGGAPVLTATLASQDAMRLSQQPLVFTVPRATGAWRWPIVTLQITGVSLTATLGPKEG